MAAAAAAAAVAGGQAAVGGNHGAVGAAAEGQPQQVTILQCHLKKLSWSSLIFLGLK